MLFKTPGNELEYSLVHPQVKAVLSATDSWCIASGYPELVITDVIHTDDEMEAFYWKQVKKNNPGVSEGWARQRARHMESWHRYGLSVDIRTRQYTKQQQANVVARLKIEMARISKRPDFWEFIDKTHGTGPHVHLARCDILWKDDYKNQKLPTKPFTIQAGLS